MGLFGRFERNAIRVRVTLPRVACLVLVIFAIAACLAAIGVGPAWADDSAGSKPNLAPLASHVQIRRTQFGVPHITGETLEAAAFGFAYCQAEDHGAEILRGILGTRGELAAAFGPGEKDENVEADFFARQFRVHDRAVESYHLLDADYRAACEGFAAGLNDYVERHRASLPAWAPRVTPHDVAAYGVAGVMRFAFNRGNILKDFYKSQGVETAMLGDADDAAEVGSNMWAFAPSRSRSGRALLMGNPHQPWAPVFDLLRSPRDRAGQAELLWLDVHRPADSDERMERVAGLVAHGERSGPGGDLRAGSRSAAAGPLSVRRRLGADRARRRGDWREGGERLDVAKANVLAHAAGTGRAAQGRQDLTCCAAQCYENHGAYSQWLRMTQSQELRRVSPRGRDERGADVQHLLRRPRGEHFLSVEWNGADAAARGAQGRGGARVALGRRVDAVSHHERPAAVVQSVGRIRAQLQLAAVFDEPERAARSRAISAVLLARTI